MAAMQPKRERTAIRRTSCSRPIARALADGLISHATKVFDYGCGYGNDIQFLRSRGIEANGWDPYHHPQNKIEPADVVNLGYVLNVIENPVERQDTLQRAFSLAKNLLIVSVRVERALDDALAYSDGVVTKRGTFQKIYTSAELRSFVEHVLGIQPHFSTPSTVYVFKDRRAEVNYIATRAFTHRFEYRTDLIKLFSLHPVAQNYIKMANQLGRLPMPEEFPLYDQLVQDFGTTQRVSRLTLRFIDQTAFLGSQAQRREDILTYLAMVKLRGLRPLAFSRLPLSLQQDIKTIWKTYRVALQESLRYLFLLGKSEVIDQICQQSPVGKLLPSHIYVHQSAEDDLPAMLRLLLFAAKQVVGEIPYNVIKIARDGRAVSFLEYGEFDHDPHPSLLRSLRVYLPKASFSLRSYIDSPNPPILHRKETLVAKDYPYFEKFRSLTHQEEEAGLLSAPDIGFRNTWNDLLHSKGLIIFDHELIPAK